MARSFTESAAALIEDTQTILRRYEAVSDACEEVKQVNLQKAEHLRELKLLNAQLNTFKFDFEIRQILRQELPAMMMNRMARLWLEMETLSNELLTLEHDIPQE